MNLLSSPRFLPTVLWLDAASCAATGLLQLALPARVAETFGLSPGLVVATGWVLLAAAALAAVGARNPQRRAAIAALIAGNALWVLGCIELLVTAPGLTGLGQAWLVLQAVAVGVLAQCEWLGLRRSRPTAWA